MLSGFSSELVLQGLAGESLSELHALLGGERSRNSSTPKNPFRLLESKEGAV